MLRDEPPDRIDQALASFDLAPLARRDVRTLSAGQRRRVALARVASGRCAALAARRAAERARRAVAGGAASVLARHLAAGGLAIAATHAPIDVAGCGLELGR